MKRLGAAAAVAAVVVACATAPTALARANGQPLHPDLITLRPTDLSITHGPNHVKFRLSNAVANRGIGPLEVFPGDPGEGACAADEQPALQRLYADDPADTDSSGFFIRADDTEVVTPDTEAGCMAYHPLHGHWHLRDFALYELWRDRTGVLAAASRKTSFCVVDNFIAPGLFGLDGVPASGYYPDPGAACSATATQGLSIGYADLYLAGIPGQRIKIDGLRRGRYCLISTADPADRLAESNDANNAYRRLLRLRPSREKVRRLPGPCALGG